MPQPDADPPVLPPGYYRLRPDSARWWSAEELAVVWHAEQWCVVPVVALAVVPQQGPGVAPPHPVASPLRALITAAERTTAAFDRLCRCVDEFEPDDLQACGECRELLDTALLELGRALAGLRGTLELVREEPSDAHPTS